MFGLYDDVDAARCAARLEPIIFLIRRSVIAALIVYLPGLPFAAMIGLVCTAIATLIYHSITCPYAEDSANMLFVANEITIAVFAVLVYFGAYLPGPVLIAAFIIPILANLITSLACSLRCSFSSRSLGPIILSLFFLKSAPPYLQHQVGHVPKGAGSSLPGRFVFAWPIPA